jgi:hypothetical protein
MNKRLQSRRHLVRLFLVLVAATSPALLTAQVPSPPNKPAPHVSSPPTSQPSPARGPAIQNAERRLGRVSLAVARNVRLLVENRTTGRITVHGWDRDVIEAHAISDRGEEVLILAQSGDDGSREVFLKADYVNLENPESPTQALDLPPRGSDGPLQIQLEVNVPRYVELELIRVIRSDVEIIGVETPINVIGHSSNVTLKDVGSVEAHTRTGSILIENARGIADVTSSTGAIRVTDSRGAVRAVSITGAIEVRCVKGRVNVGNTQAPIELVGIDGDVEAIASSSNVRFTGPLSGDGRYYLKSMSGRVEMIVPADTRGFNATLTSYRGMVESDFSLPPQPIPQDAETAGHRLSGRFGNGSPQITLDSFDGLVRLTKMASTPKVSCQ